MNLMQRVEIRGWSMTGVSPVPQAPRNCARWNRQEEADLRIAFNRGLTLSRIGELFGRTRDGILYRLDELGLAEYSPAQGCTMPNSRTIASAEDNARFDFYPAVSVDPVDPVDPYFIKEAMNYGGPPIPSHPNCRSFLKPVTIGVPTVKLTANKLMLLLSIYRGTFFSELKCSTASADLCFLQVNELIKPKSEGDFLLTDSGKAFVDHLLDKSDLTGGVSTSYNGERSTSVLADGTFFMVANGDVTKEGSGTGQLLIKNSPKVVQPTQSVAEKEAVRLAKFYPEQKFFVLKAVSVHQTTTSVALTRL